MKRLKILYVAMKYDYGVPERGLSFEHCNFFETLARLGCDIVTFDFLSLLQRHGKYRMNDRLREVVEEEKPDILFSCLYKNEIDKETMRRITEESDTVTVNWFCDDHWRFEKFSSRYATCFDWVATTVPEAADTYRRLGQPNVHCTQWAVNPFTYVPSRGPLAYDVTFVGQPYGHRRAVIEELQRQGIAVEAFGGGWPVGRISQEKMVEVFGKSRINLNFTAASVPVNRLFGRPRTVRQIKGRSFEVPGCGGFLLTEDAAHLSEYYEPGKDIVVFQSAKELAALIAYYHAHEEERALIARAGYERTMREHTYVHRFHALFTAMGFVLPVVDDVLAGRVAPGAVREVSITSEVPLVSVVMPVYNGERFVAEAIESILRQTFHDFEFIIVDDGSTDGTAAILARAAAENPRIRVLTEHHRGKVHARNTGCKAARGEFVAVMDSDDRASPARLTREVVFLEEHPEIGVLGSWVELIDEAGTVRGRLTHAGEAMFVAWSLHMRNTVANASAMLRREVGERLGWYRDTAAEDYDLWVRAMQITKLDNIQEVLAQHRMWNRSYTHSHEDKQEASAAEIIRCAAEQIGVALPLETAQKMRLLISTSEFFSARDAWELARMLRRLRFAFLQTHQCSTFERQHIARSFAAMLLLLAKRTSGGLVRMALILRAVSISSAIPLRWKRS